jgi:2-iminoacetate synthase ThiH
MKYECVICFTVDKCDDDGFHTGKEKLINEGTIWEISEDAVNVTGAEIHLERVFKSKKAKTCEWIEIPKSYLDKYFEKID